MLFNSDLEEGLMCNLSGKVRMKIMGVKDAICFAVICYLETTQ